MAEATHTPSVGVEISLRIGQRVRHRDHAGKRVTGIVNSLQVESEQGLTASVILDEPIIIPARGEGDREIRINWQTCPVTEFAPFDDRDELIAEMLTMLNRLIAAGGWYGSALEFDHGVDGEALKAEVDAVIAKVEGPNHG